MKVVDVSLVIETKEALRAGKFIRPDEWIQTINPNDLLTVLDSCCAFLYRDRENADADEDACALGLGLAASWQPYVDLGGRHAVEVGSVVDSVSILAIVCCYEYLRRLGWVTYKADSLLVQDGPLDMVPLRPADQIVEEIDRLNHNLAESLEWPIRTLSLIHAMEEVDRKEQERNAEGTETEKGSDGKQKEGEVADPKTP